MTKLDTITLYHIATDINDFRSFFRDGAKSITPRSEQGFYVWTNEELADTHFRLLDGNFLNKTLKNREAMMLGFCVDKKNITYPLWQMDLEFAPGLYDLLAQYTPNLKNQKLDMDLPPNDSFLKKITGISCQKKDESILFNFKGKTSVNTDMNLCVIHHNNQPCQNHADIIFFQTLINTLHQNNNDFCQAYSKLMQYSPKVALKYTGEKPLEITFAKHVKFDDKENLKKTVVFDRTKGANQICPFLKIKNAQR